MALLPCSDVTDSICSSVSWNIDLLAICLGTFNGLDHFYTNTGKWLTSSSIHTRFVVKSFIKDLSEWSRY